jgi:hypothetical protein
MQYVKLFREIITTYRRHQWQLRRVLLRPETCAALGAHAKQLFDEAELQTAEFDALWFARPSPAGREAWELRLVTEQRYALFEAFEPDETENAREEVRQEMENRMRDQVARTKPGSSGARQ